MKAYKYGQTYMRKNRNPYVVLVGKPEGKRPVGTPGHR
jgi:hypothetical protein